MKVQRRYVRNHIVVGIMDKRTGVPRERLVEDILNGQLFESIRRISRQLRPWWRRMLSLKSIQGFAIYECLPDHAYHRSIELGHRTEPILTEFYHDYSRRNVLAELRWLPWIQEHFNQGDSNPDKRCYALQLVLRWSITKITVYGLTPMLLSLAIGF
ncbi:hypothetical protein AOQ84DRAFT_336800 [Glonium stellatum]|uniref:Uncharacterized protein n=1 Tax=Glonium stellatum TaxID=574774 RepID=A0A8E2JVN7_9PEZI|nr:hypothetical protein AOQ84DRAFT_336800 [Glonium stellatum]